MPYFRKKEPTEAIRWTGENHGEMALFLDRCCPGPTGVVQGDVVLLMFEDWKEEVLIGSWIVRGSQGELVIMSDYAFQLLFTEVPEGHVLGDTAPAKEEPA